MAVDASIPLSVNPAQQAGPDLGRTLTLADFAMKLKQSQQQMAGQNALKQIFSNPESVDATGNPTPQAMSRIMAVDPSTGMALRQNQLKTEQQRLTLDATKTETYGKKLDLMNDEATKALSVYEDEMGKGIPEPQARAKAQEAYSTSREGLAKSGLFSEQEIDRISPQFDPMKVRSFALSYKDRKMLEEKQKADTRADKREDRMATHAERMEELAGKRIEQAAGRDPAETKWDVRQDKDGTEYRYNPATAKATTLTGAPYEIKGSAGKVGTAKEATEGMSPEAVKLAAQQYLAGDKSAVQNVGRGTQGAKDLRSIRGEIAKQAAESGMSGADIAAKIGEFEGVKAGERTLSTRSANIEMAVNEADQFATLALEQSQKVGRTKFIPINRALQSWEKNTGDPDIRAFGAANNSFINAYARAVSPSGTPTVSDKDHAREMLETADSQEQYKAVIGQLKKEMAAAQKSPGVVREELRKAVTGTGDKPATVSAPGPTDTKVTGDYYVPQPLKGMKNLQWSSSRKQFRDPDTNTVYDMDGKPVTQ